MRRLGLGIATILLIGLFSACNDDEAEDENKEDIVIPVETVEAKEGDLVIEKSLYGRTAPAKMTPVMVQIAGEMDVLEVENGDEVEKDDLIAKLKTPAGIQNVTASSTGEIVQLEADEGDLIPDSDPLAMIADMEKMNVNTAVTSNVRSLLKKEDKMKSTINDEEYEAEITSIGTIPDETGLYPIEASIENKDKTILPGMIVKLTIPEKRIKEAIILPTEAVIEENEGTYIYIVEDGEVTKVEINIKVTQSDQSAIEGEVNEGDQIVVNGQLTLSDGSKVSVVKEGNQS